MNYFVSFGNYQGRMTGQDFVYASSIEQARIKAQAMCAKHEHVLYVEEVKQRAAD